MAVRSSAQCCRSTYGKRHSEPSVPVHDTSMFNARIYRCGGFRRAGCTGTGAGVLYIACRTSVAFWAGSFNASSRCLHWPAGDGIRLTTREWRWPAHDRAMCSWRAVGLEDVHIVFGSAYLVSKMAEEHLWSMGDQACVGCLGSIHILPLGAVLGGTALPY